jgi:hypothetical protein
MNRRSFLETLGAIGIAPLVTGRPLHAQAGWNAGVATADITPERSLWMAGFAARKEASQGTALPLHAKALALQAGSGAPAVLVTVDLLGVTADICDAVARTLTDRHRLARANLLVNASHTHCGPVIDEQLAVAYDITDAGWDRIREYTHELPGKLAAVAGEALSRLQPARLSYGVGEAGFAANRRTPFTPDGPVDRSVPVLRVDAADGALKAIVFGYACHNTTLPPTFVRFHGDYAGVAQAVLERAHPGATALFVAGCGADANPKPRGTIELVEQHGAALAQAVDRTLQSVSPLSPSLTTRYGIVELPFVQGESREAWRKQLTIDDVFLQRHAEMMQAVIDRRGRLPESQPDPVQVWRLGTDLALVALGGEVVVDYDLRLRREHPSLRIWAAGYSNDVFGYVPSRRVLEEGGYEGGDSMVYYGRPAPFTPAVEELIVAEVERLLKS